MFGQLRKLPAQLNIFCDGLKAWRLKNGNKPNDNLGVADREDVWKIASKERYKYDEKFADVRRYLIRQLMKETHYRYSFDGEVYWSNNRLENELAKIDREIAKLKEKK